MSKSSKSPFRSIGTSLRDLIILVIGILLSFTLSNWQQQNADSKEEQRIISLLYEDLKSDTALINSNIKSIELLRSNYDSIMKYRANPNETNPLFLYSVAYSIVNFVPFQPQQTAYIQFTYHENAASVNNKEILSGLIGLFTNEYATLESINETHKNFLLDKLMVRYFNWFPSIQSQYDITPERSEQILALLENEEFLNMIQFDVILKLNIERSYKQSLVAIEEILGLIEGKYGEAEWLNVEKPDSLAP